MFRRFLLTILAATCGTLVLQARPAEARQIRIVASTTDLGSIASSVGGADVEVTAISRPNGDPHRVEVLPSYMVKVARADLYLKVGLGLDQWADQIVDGSHSGSVKVIDCSKGVPVLEKPTGKVSADMGDVHPDGNPHYWLDPRNAGLVAGTISEALSAADPGHAADYAARAGEFARAAEGMVEKGKAAVLALPSRKLVTYHGSWSYFANAFGFKVVITLEPVPGIPPTARHLDRVVGIVKQEKPIVILQEPYFSLDAGKFLMRETGVRLVVASASAEDVAAGSYLSHIQTLIDQVTTVVPVPASGR